MHYGTSIHKDLQTDMLTCKNSGVKKHTLNVIYNKKNTFEMPNKLGEKKNKQQTGCKHKEKLTGTHPKSTFVSFDHDVVFPSSVMIYLGMKRAKIKSAET